MLVLLFTSLRENQDVEPIELVEWASADGHASSSLMGLAAGGRLSCHGHVSGEVPGWD